MNLERGFRRIIVTISLALFFTALGLTGYVTYRAASHISANATYRKCVRQAGFDLWVPGLRAEDLDLMRKIGDQQGVYVRCRETAGFAKTAPPAILYQLWGFYWSEWSLGKVILLTGGLGVLLGVGAVVITWAIYYLGCWLVKGFKDPRS